MVVDAPGHGNPVTRCGWMGGLTAGLALLLLAGCSTSDPPLGNGYGDNAGEECTPGKTLADGFYTLQNSSNETVTVIGVRLVGGAGQRITSPAYLIPQYQTGNGGDAIPGLDYWPLHWPTWQDRKRVPATIAPHVTTNLVFAQTRTSDHPKSVGVQVSYTAGGNSFTWTETQVRVLVGVKC